MAATATRPARSATTATGAATAAWHLRFPQTISYRALSADPKVECGQTDATFDHELMSEHLDGYEIYVIAGHDGDCGRLKGEQLKRLHPAKMVILYEASAADDPRTWPGGTWAGYYLMMNRTTALGAVGTQQTNIKVANPAMFSVGDTAVMWSPTPSDPYANSEWVSITAINATTLTVTRDFFGTGAQRYVVSPLVAAVGTGPGHPRPDFNLSDVAPVNPATGTRAWQWLATNLASDFAASSAGQPTMDGMELDAVGSTPWPVVKNTNGAIKNVDCNGDGIIDYCQRNVGTAQQVDAYGAGYDKFLQALEARLSAYDTDPTRPAKLLLNDGSTGQRSIEALGGAEFESYPSWDNYVSSSPALQTLRVWATAAGRPGDRLSYAYTKDATPLYPGAGCVSPAHGGTCRNGDVRFGMGSALVDGAASSYDDGDGFFDAAQPWDEEATIDVASTGLTPGYLGVPRQAARRITRFTSGELALNGGFEQNLTGASVRSVVPGAVALSRDITTAAPRSGTASLRADVTRLTPTPRSDDARVSVGVAPINPGEYTVEFWAKATNPIAGPPAMVLGIAFPGVSGGASSWLLLTSTWRRYVLQYDVSTAMAAPVLRLGVGAQIGRYWIDGVSVHAGTAGILLREFTNGIVVLNDSFSDQTNIPLPDGPYHHIDGVQDATVNDGSSVGSLLPVVASKDAVILLRG